MSAPLSPESLKAITATWIEYATKPRPRCEGCILVAHGAELLAEVERLAQHPRPTVHLTVNLSASAPWEVSEAVHNLFAALRSEGVGLSTPPIHVTVNTATPAAEKLKEVMAAEINRAIAHALQSA